MKKEQIAALFERFENAQYHLDNVECWSARDLQSIFNYVQWRNFTKVIDKAKESCQNAGNPVSDHFADVSKMVSLGSGAQRKVEDIAMTRYGCYLTVQNGDPAKEIIARGQTYFAAQTRRHDAGGAAHAG